jgi:hypothetical protein
VKRRDPKLRKLIAVVTTALAVGGVLFVTVGPASGAGGSTTIHLTAHATSQNFIPAAGEDKNNAQGSMFAENDTLLSTTGKHIGHAGVYGVVTTPEQSDAGEAILHVSAVLDGRGEIIAEGLFDTTAKTSTIAVIGGTG